MVASTSTALALFFEYDQDWVDAHDICEQRSRIHRKASKLINVTE
jgi:hypothetical protein